MNAPRQLMVLRHLFASVAEEMGAALRQSALSPNIKERLDFSCALLDAQGRLVSHAAHIPVHLGSAHLTVPAVLAEIDPGPGDILVLNDPHRGGTHLNDVTVLAPFYFADQRIGFLMNRAHHADVGGAEPGSMSGARDLFGEGLILPPVHLMRAREWVPEVWRLFEANVRDPQAARGDLQAQCAALKRGAIRMRDLCLRFGQDDVVQGMADLLRHGEKLTAALLRSWPNKTGRAQDYLDGPDTPLICCRIEKRGARLRLDFSGSSDQVMASWNTHKAVATSAVFYVLQALSSDEIPETSGTLSCVDLHFPPASVISAQFPAGVAIGNVETSQRIVDVILLALSKILDKALPACSQGTMNNVLFGGHHPDGRPFVYYETLAGGAGGGPAGVGASAVQVHMTNTRNTPVEVMENELPVRVVGLGIRRGSGGAGRSPGGDGICKEVEFLEAARLTVTGTRRHSGAPGIHGGSAGKPGYEEILRQGSKRYQRLQPGVTIEVRPGDRLRIHTPGGGGWGKPPKSVNGASRLTNPAC
jgi:N-methylhydantoinase B